MNIFVVADNEHPRLSAIQLCDKHIIKMPLETAQMLSTAHRVLCGKLKMSPSVTGKRVVRYWVLPDEREQSLYKAVHVNHPCTVWARKTLGNFIWLYDHGIALCNEFEKRFGNVHKSKAVIQQCMDKVDALGLVDLNKTPHPLCMPEEYKTKCAVESYRNYYHGEKSHFATWPNPPTWWQVLKMG